MIEFGAHTHLVWTLVLTGLLFLPVRRLIWVLSVRRAQARADGKVPDEATRASLKRRAGVTAALLCFVFAYLYIASMLRG